MLAQTTIWANARSPWQPRLNLLYADDFTQGSWPCALAVRAAIGHDTITLSVHDGNAPGALGELWGRVVKVGCAFWMRALLPGVHHSKKSLAWRCWSPSTI